ncbi:MAG: adenylate/guanylate cyclase domain-containing protein [Terriglobales bacterium]
MARLIITSPDGKRGVFEIGKPVITIGRGSANDLVLNDPSVSRLHAVLKKSADDHVSIADRGSTNGVVIDGVRVPDEVPLSHGARVKIGIYDLKLEAQREPARDAHDAALVVQKAEIPAALRDVLHGKVLPQQPKSGALPAIADSAALREQYSKLTKENFLLRMLYDAGKVLNAHRTVPELVSEVVQLTFRIEGVQRGSIMFIGPNGEITEQSEVRYRTTPIDDQPQITFSRSILQRIMQEREPILVTDLSADDRFIGSESIKVSGMQSAMCAPLISPNTGTILGVLYVDNLSKSSAFSQEELNVFAVVATQAAAAIENVMAHKRIADQEVQRRALARFLAPEVVELIASNPEGIRLGGVNQKVTILFCDIRGFTSMSENLPPENVVEILNEYFSRVTDVIFDHGGTLDKYIGDAAMAIFGAPFTKGNDAVNAVNAAIAIQSMIAELNRDAAERGHPELKIGVGINTGVVTAGNIGSSKRLDYTVIGDAVNLASRMCGKAAAGQILVTESTFNEVSAQFAMLPLPPVMVKGKSQPINIFTVQWKEAAAAV